MNPEQYAFILALDANEDDTATRLVYADWLEEHDQPEEADRMRAWTTAKAWLTKFKSRMNYGDGDNPHTYEDILEAGRCAVSGEGFCFGTTRGPEFFYNEKQSREFFHNWSIVTGVKVPEEVIEQPPFRCAC